jgi:hypothetical protein
VKRLYASITDTGNGAVYRHVGTTNECIDTFIVEELPPPDCEVFPTTAENLGSFPYHYGTQDEIDTEAFISALSILDGASYSPSYPNMWNKLDAPTQASILAYAEQCFCAGEGIDIIRLITGKPRFPDVDPIPWFYIPTAVTASPLTVRPNNPDGPPLPETCCPDGETPGIAAEIVAGELRLTRAERPEKDYIFRKDDTDESMQRTAGFPKWCCLPDPSVPGKFAMRYLDFPSWPRKDTHDPAPDVGGGKEPLAIIPVVTDIGCTTDGELKVYWANLVVHDGKVTDIQWDVQPPRSDPAGADYTVAPDDPETLAVNKDYQSQDVLVEGFAAPLPGPDGNCDQAAAVIGLAPCAPQCPPDGDICPPGGASNDITSNGATEDAAVLAAFAAADAAKGVCEEPTYLCGVEEQANGTFDATVKYCC